MRTRHPRVERPEVPPQFGPMLASYDLALRAEGRSAKTRTLRRDAARWLAGHLADEVADWDEVIHLHVRAFFAMLSEAGYSKAYINNIGRSLQAFAKWYAIEEDRPNWFGAKLKVPEAPKLGENPVPVIAREQMALLIKDAECGRSFEDRRDAAILRSFACTGGRLAELAALGLAEVDLGAREMTVTGKARKVRTVRIDHKAALAVDRYLRIRAKHRAAQLPALWLSSRRQNGMTADGIYQMLRRRAARLGIADLHPHLFRHTFAHNWLDAGGAEGDLMELMGWDSPQMLRHYGASARSARARRAYDRVDVMGGV